MDSEKATGKEEPPPRMKTFGPKPESFKLAGSDEEYNIGSAFGNYIRCKRGTLYKKYSKLWRRMATKEERTAMQEMKISGSEKASNIVLLKKSEVDEILAGGAEKFMDDGSRESLSQVSAPASQTRKTRGSFIPQVTGNDHHNDPLPCRTPVNRHRPISVVESKFDMFRVNTADISKEQHEKLINHQVNIVPIRLDMEIDTFRLRDYFNWDRNNELISPEMFAELLCDDLNLPIEKFVPAIAEQINLQVEEFPKVTYLPDRDSLDTRVLIRLNIHCANTQLTDNFEWDLSEEDNDPDAFAEQLCADMGIGGEFISAVSYQIRMQVAHHIKNFDPDSVLPAVDNIFRFLGDAETVYAPNVETLNDQDLERNLKAQDRNTRRMRRAFV